MKNKRIFSFGKFDERDIYHFLLGIVIYSLILLLLNEVKRTTNFEFGLEVKYISFILMIFITTLWEFRQRWFYSAPIDIKDILIGLLGPAAFTFIIL